MKKIYLLCLLISFLYSTTSAQQQYRKPVKPTKNVILMIPDGTSTSVLSVARWYQKYNKTGGNLAIDPYLCGLVNNYLSNSPVPDSAPAMSGYMTGMPQRQGNISVYPIKDKNQDIVTVDSLHAYQPLATILEAAKYDRKSTGLVSTIEFCHATPAACASHYYDRGKYEILAPQIAYNDVDIVFGGGTKVLTDDMKQYLTDNGTIVLEKDVDAFRKFNGDEKLWALFSDYNMGYERDRDSTKMPSLAEMTQKAIDRLSENEDGFFLMVEGSLVDYGAHANDPIAIIGDFLAFDKAVQVALDFAKAKGETTVVVLPDHGNSGFTFGDKDYSDYSKKGLDPIYENVSKYKRTASGMEEIVLESNPNDIKALFKEYTDIDLTEKELREIKKSRHIKEDDYMKVSSSKNLLSTISEIMNSRTHFGFVSGNHTAEDVFLAVYHPNGDLPTGLNTCTDINNYLADALGITRTLSELTDELYAKHSNVFADLKYSIDKSKKELTVKKGKDMLVIPAYKSVVYLNGEAVKLNSVVVYIDKNNTFYLPRNLVELFQ